MMTEELLELLPPPENGSLAPDRQTEIQRLLQNTLQAPVDYPPLTDSIFPGDRVTILVQNGLPAARATLESLLNVLEMSKIETADILVVVPQSMTRVFDLVEETPADPDANLPATWRMRCEDPPSSASRPSAVCFEVHATDNERAAAYLAANEQGNPVYVNRSLCDSDVILPLSCLTPNQKLSDCLYPEFSNDETRARYRKKKDSRNERLAEVELANDALGLFFSIELICSPGEVIEDIVCGNRTQVRKIASSRLELLWQLDLPEDCDAVVTSIESSASSATWSDVVRAVNAAADRVPAGPIIVWTELAEKPGAKVKTACLAQFEGSIPGSLAKPLQHFASVLCERPVYLRSRLSRNTVEELGLGYVESAESARRILGASSKPQLIRDGHLR